MELPLYNQEAKQVGTVSLSDRVFGVKMNKDLLHQVVTSQLSNKRQVVAHAKGRGEVRGGGKKPWRQKGTGRARHGSIRSPIWKGGGVTHGPTKEKNFKKKINKKMMHKALLVALSAKARDGQLIVVDALNIQNAKTKEMAKVMKNFLNVFGKLNSVLLVTPQGASNLHRASKNLAFVDSVEARNLNPLIVLASTIIMVPQEALTTLEK